MVQIKSKVSSHGIFRLLGLLKTWILFGTGSAWCKWGVKNTMAADGSSYVTFCHTNYHELVVRIVTGDYKKTNPHQCGSLLSNESYIYIHTYRSSYMQTSKRYYRVDTMYFLLPLLIFAHVYNCFCTIITCEYLDEI